jgi:hypothetical protein
MNAVGYVFTAVGKVSEYGDFCDADLKFSYVPFPSLEMIGVRLMGMYACHTALVLVCLYSSIPSHMQRLLYRAVTRLSFDIHIFHVKLLVPCARAIG